MDNLIKLFETCANGQDWLVVGNDVNYKFEKDYDNRKLTIYFQGSNSKIDWIRNFSFKKRPYKNMETPFRVHRGFLAAWKEVEDIIKKEILDSKDDPYLRCKINKYGEIYNTVYTWKEIVVVGYSHGAALATLCHEFVWFNRADIRYNNMLRGYGFEGPRVIGKFKLNKALSERWETFMPIRNCSDIVTHVPPVIFGFTHVNDVVHIGKEKGYGPIRSHYPDVVLSSLEEAMNNGGIKNMERVTDTFVSPTKFLVVTANGHEKLSTHKNNLISNRRYKESLCRVAEGPEQYDNTVRELINAAYEKHLKEFTKLYPKADEWAKADDKRKWYIGDEPLKVKDVHINSVLKSHTFEDVKGFETEMLDELKDIYGVEFRARFLPGEGDTVDCYIIEEVVH